MQNDIEKLLHVLRKEEGKCVKISSGPDPDSYGMTSLLSVMHALKTLKGRQLHKRAT